VRNGDAQTSDQAGQTQLGQGRVLADDDVDERVDLKTPGRDVARTGLMSVNRIDPDPRLAPLPAASR
jgi:hypothetical protein